MTDERNPFIPEDNKPEGTPSEQTPPQQEAPNPAPQNEAPQNPGGPYGAPNPWQQSAYGGGFYQPQPPKPPKKPKKVSGWVIGLAALAAAIYALISTGTLSGIREKFSRGASEISGGLFGKKPDDKDDPPSK